MEISPPELLKFEKILTINRYDFDFILESMQRLFVCMKETNTIHSCYTEFFSFRLKDSEKIPFAKDMILHWASVANV